MNNRAKAPKKITRYSMSFNDGEHRWLTAMMRAAGEKMPAAKKLAERLERQRLQREAAAQEAQAAE